MAITYEAVATHSTGFKPVDKSKHKAAIRYISFCPALFVYESILW